MNRNLSIVFSILLLVGIIAPAYGQTNYDDVVINEVDINPFGDDSVNVNEWIELYNPTDSDIDLGGWEIASTTGIKKTMTISPGTIIKSGEFLTYQYQTVWFTDVNESVELRDENGIVIDKTPVISDIQNDFTSWQRIYDGYDLDSYDDWKFETSTTGLSNGKLVEIQKPTEITVTVSSEKSSYLFGDVAIITGSISEVFAYKQFFQPEQILVIISGGNFYKTVTLYPDLNLNYETTLSLHHVLGINEGIYDVSVNYAGATANTNFSVESELVEQETKEDSSFSITTDKTQYLPGQQVSITGFTTETIPFQGMKFSVKDSQRTIIYSGTLFPTNGEFATNIFLTTVNPNYGTYEIIAEYFDKADLTTFEVVEDFKEDEYVASDEPLTIFLDKEIYEFGDKMIISGLIKNPLSNTNYETGSHYIGSSVAISFSGDSDVNSGVIVSLDFTALPDTSGNYSLQTDVTKIIFTDGNYVVKAQYLSNTATKTFTVIDPFVFNPDDPISLLVSTDKSEYHPGDTVIITGNSNKPIYLENFDVSVIQKADIDIMCAYFSCGIHAGPVTSIRTSPFGSFTHEFMIPNSMSAVGSYEITVDADFEIKRIQFDVIEKPQTLKLNTVIEKENRIPGKIIPILTEEKIVDNESIAPRVLSGSLITPSRADESNVNLKISTATGICIIGPDADCLVKESTRKQGQIYDVVEVDGISLNVRYSGPDVRLEKFSILPESSTEFLPDANWNVEVIKDDQVSRFYYKITYKTLE